MGTNTSTQSEHNSRRVYKKVDVDETMYAHKRWFVHIDITPFRLRQTELYHKIMAIQEENSDSSDAEYIYLAEYAAIDEEADEFVNRKMEEILNTKQIPFEFPERYRGVIWDVDDEYDLEHELPLVND